MRPSVPDVHITDSQDTELASYRALASQAVVGLLLGLSSPVAALDPAFWTVPVLGVFFSGWALRRIKRDPLALAGQKLAWVGLTLSLLVATAAPANWLTHRLIVRNEAREFSSLWLRYVTHDQPQKAHQLTAPPQDRRPLNDQLWNFYRNTPRARKALEGYVQGPLVRTLLALGPRANVRFYETSDQAHDDTNDLVELVYAITYEDEGEKKSFLVVVEALRTKLSDGRADWQILGADISGKPKP